MYKTYNRLEALNSDVLEYEAKCPSHLGVFSQPHGHPFRNRLIL